jgi:ribose 5-phosphate isomerase
MNNASPIAYLPILSNLKKMGGEPILRMAKSKAGPCVADNGNMMMGTLFGVIDIENCCVA